MGNCGSFARAALSPLKLAMAVYPEARVNIDERPVSSFTPPLPSPVSERKVLSRWRLDSPHGYHDPHTHQPQALGGTSRRDPRFSSVHRFTYRIIL